MNDGTKTMADIEDEMTGRHVILFFEGFTEIA